MLKIIIWTSPLEFELRGSHRWLQNVITQEFAHIISIQKSKNVKSKLFLGHAGWDSGQLEREIENGDWLIQKSSTSIIFEQEIDNIWIMATNSLGIEIGDISNTSGYS